MGCKKLGYCTQRLTPPNMWPVTNFLPLSRLCSSLGAIARTTIPAETAMKRPILSLICLACILNASAVAMYARAADNSPDRTAPSYDMKAQALLDLQGVNKKCVDL